MASRFSDIRSKKTAFELSPWAYSETPNTMTANSDPIAIAAQKLSSLHKI
jgi:hypothetical protein